MACLNDVSTVERQYFHEPSMSLARGVYIDTAPYIGISLTNDEILRLSGAPSDSYVNVHYRDEAYWEATDPDDIAPSGLYFYVASPKYVEAGQEHIVGVYVTDENRLGVYIKNIYFRRGGVLPDGFAGRMLVRVARTAELLGIDEMRMMAAGGRLWPDIGSRPGDRYTGYAAWPLYGFDMPIDRDPPDYNAAIVDLFPYFPPSMSTCNSVQGILGRKGGHTFWREVGHGYGMRFDLTLPSTTSVDILLARVAKKGV